MRIRSIIFLALVPLLLVGAFALSSLLILDGNPRSYTQRDLTVLAECITEMHNRQIDVSHFHTLSEFVTAAVDERLLVVTKRGEFYFDGWHHPFYWKTQREDEKIIIIIESAGRNAIPENGLGDDLSVIITIPNQGQASFYLKPPE